MWPFAAQPLEEQVSKVARITINSGAFTKQCALGFNYLLVIIRSDVALSSDRVKFKQYLLDKASGNILRSRHMAHLTLVAQFPRNGSTYVLPIG